MRNNANPAELEYESLPPALRRKYFSSLERLRLANSNGVAHPPPVLRTKSSQDSPRISTRRKSLFDSSNSPFQTTLNPVRRHLRRSSTAPSALINTDKAAWFASLPATVRRKHFTQEEQILFANQRHSVILDAADELFHRRCLQESPLDPPPLLCPDRPHTSYLPDNADGLSFLDDTNSDHDDAEEEEAGMANYSLDKFPWLEDEPELELELDDYHTAIAETARRQAASGHRRSFRRNISLSSFSLRRDSITSNYPNYNPLGRSSALPLQTPSSFLPPPSPTHHRSKASISSIDPRATHYQDPAARMKLRVYLASPSKFDEAIEFGFPSLQDKSLQQQERPKTSPRLTNESGRTFFTDDTPSLLGDDVSSHDGMESSLDPRTPDDAEFRINRKSRKVSNDRQSIKPQMMRNFSEQYAQATTLDREMTIHMTLTRPDLRSPEEVKVSQVNSLPLEHSALPNSDKKVSIWDTLPEDESKVKKFWRKLKMR